jgi:hypothetical protein
LRFEPEPASVRHDRLDSTFTEDTVIVTKLYKVTWLGNPPIAEGGVEAL